MSVSFLDKNKRASLPTGGSFSPTGMISKWMAALVYRAWSPDGEPPESLLDPALGKASVRKAGSGAFVYFKSRELADNFNKEMGNEYAPQQFWHFETTTADVLNFATEDARNSFGSHISYDVRVTTLASNKYRHELHMIALPAAVNAMAKILGYSDESGYPGVDFSELMQRDLDVTDQMQFELVGNPDAKAGDTGEGEEDDPLPNIHYEHSKLWLRRANLWKFLGESNPKAYNMQGTGTKFDTDSEKLSECLAIIGTEWTEPAWARIATIADPRVDAVAGDKRLSVPVIWELFASEADAREAAKADVERMNSGSEGSGSAPASSVKPALPGGDWDGISEADWIASLKPMKAEHSPNGVLTPPVKAKIAGLLSCSPDDVSNWWDLV